jgi:hypothetical protein
VKPLVYLAGPLTIGRPTMMHNVAEATQAFEYLRLQGVAGFCPHWSAFVAFCLPDASYEDWMDYNFAVIDRCDLLIRLPGQSQGADREWVYAARIGLPVVMRDGEHDWTWRELCDKAVVVLRRRGKL